MSTLNQQARLSVCLFANVLLPLHRAPLLTLTPLSTSPHPRTSHAICLQRLERGVAAVQRALLAPDTGVGGLDAAVAAVDGQLALLVQEDTVLTDDEQAEVKWG